MYEVFPDPYCYRGSDVLKNRLGIHDPAKLAEFELVIATQRSSEPLPNGRFGTGHYKAIHRHLFLDVYRWAGKYRTVGLAKGDSVFCQPEYIPAQMERLFRELRGEDRLRGLSREGFASEAGSFLATLNAIHPFREGNGRTQLSFLTLLASRAGHPLNLNRLAPRAFLEAMIRSFYGDEDLLTDHLRRLVS